MMLILGPEPLPPDTCETPISPLNALWAGKIGRALPLPRLGHLFLVFPLGGAQLACPGAVLGGDQYLWLSRAPESGTVSLQNLNPDGSRAWLLLLLLSPAFIADMAGFLKIPAEMDELLHATPLLQGDAISDLLAQLGAGDLGTWPYEEVEELFMEVVGQVLYLLRLRHQALAGLAGRKAGTLTDLLPRLMQARQFIEARYLEPIKTQDVAGHVALSEFHFARLFKTAFEVTVHQYVVRLRLDRARHLLESGIPVTEVALEVGYDSLSAFIRAFGRQYGLTPSAYAGR